MRLAATAAGGWAVLAVAHAIRTADAIAVGAGPEPGQVALRAVVYFVPLALVGAEEQAPAVNIKPLADALGWPAFPVTPVPPFLAVLPLPVKYRIYFGEPMHFEGDPDDDDEVIRADVDRVRDVIGTMLSDGLKARQHVFW